MKNVIITGTSRGIGYELVKIFGSGDFQVLALSRNPEPVISLNLPNVTAISCDLNVEEDIKKVSDLITNWKSLDIVINNAGKVVNKPFLETSLQEFEDVFNTNVFGVARLLQVCIPKMDQSGHVVNISSMGGVQGSVKFPGLSAYSSSKGALITLTELLAEEFKENGPAINVLALGAVQTEMLGEAFPGYQAPTQPKEMAEYIYNFSLTGNKFYNGKLLQVSNSTP